MQNVVRVLNEKFLCGLFLFDSLKSEFKSEEEMIPWELEPEFEENKINSLLQLLRGSEEKELGYSKEAHARWWGDGNMVFLLG